MALFDDALRATLRFEGGYVDDPADHGGATNQGITQAVYDAYRGAGNERDVKDISGEEVADIYQHRYWNAAGCEQVALLSNRLAWCLFDCAVHSGPVQALKLLQFAVSAPVDGILGPTTMAKIAAQIAGAGEENVVLAFLGERQAFLNRLIAKDPSQAKFQAGWTKRVQQLKTITQDV